MWDHLTSGFSPPLPGDENLILRSLPGGGKTTFLMSDPNTLHLCGELQGASWVVGSRCETDFLGDWKRFDYNMNLLEQDARKNGEKKRFRSVSLDTIGQIIESVFAPHWCELNKVKEIEGFDHGKLAKYVMYWLRKINQWGYAWHLGDHILTQRVTVNKTEKIVTESVLTQSIRKLIDQECSQILTLELRDIRTDENGKALPIDQWRKECWATTKPGSKTSLANPKARVWIPQEFKIPSVEEDPEGYGFLAYEAVYNKAIERMQAVEDSVRSGTPEVVAANS